MDKAQSQKRQHLHHDDIRNDLHIHPQPVQTDKAGRNRQHRSRSKAGQLAERYVYNAMASLSIATLCYQELHGIAVNFLKSYLAVALQGAVLYLVIGFYPALAGSLGTGGSITEQAWAMLGQSVILLVAVFMSGKFTKAITNAVG